MNARRHHNELLAINTIDVINVHINIKTLKTWKNIQKRCKRLIKMLPTFAMNPAIHTLSSMYRLSNLISASQIFCSIGYVTNQNQ